MIELLESKEDRIEKKKTWSNEFLLPLTGLKKTDKYDINSYLFWKENSINDYKFIITLEGGEYDEMVEYARKSMFPYLDDKGYLLENYDVENTIIFILDMSEWAFDIDKFMVGKYSKFSREAKEKIEKYHTNKGEVSLQLMAILYPNKPQPLLERKTPMLYVAENYGYEYDDLEKIGELGSPYNQVTETLVRNIEDIDDEVKM